MERERSRADRLSETLRLLGVDHDGLAASNEISRLLEEYKHEDTAGF